MKEGKNYGLLERVPRDGDHDMMTCKARQGDREQRSCVQDGSLSDAIKVLVLAKQWSRRWVAVDFTRTQNGTKITRQTVGSREKSNIILTR